MSALCSALSVNPAMALVSSPSDSEEKTLVLNQTVANQTELIDKKAESIFINVLNNSQHPDGENYDGLDSQGIVMLPIPVKKENNKWELVPGVGNSMNITSTGGDITIQVQTTPTGFQTRQQTIGRAIYAAIPSTESSQRTLDLNSANDIVVHTIAENPFSQRHLVRAIQLSGKIFAKFDAVNENRILLDAIGEQKTGGVREGITQRADAIYVSGSAKLLVKGKRNFVTMQAPTAQAKYILNAQSGLYRDEANIEFVATEGNNELAVDTVFGFNDNVYDVIGVAALYGTSNNTAVSRIRLLAEKGKNIIKVGSPQQGSSNTIRGVMGLQAEVFAQGNRYYGKSGEILLQAHDNIIDIYAPNVAGYYGIKGFKYGIRALGARLGTAENIKMEAQGGTNVLRMDTYVSKSFNLPAPEIVGIYSIASSEVLLSALNGSNVIQIGEQEDETSRIDGTAIGLWANSAGVSLQAKHNQVVLHSPVSMQPIAISARGFYTGAPNILLNASDTNTVYSLSQGIYASTQAKVVLNATNTNQIGAGSTAITSWDKAAVQLSAGKMNNISAGNTALLTATEGQIAIDGPVNIQAPSVADARSSSKISIYYEKNSQMQGNLRATDKGMIDVRSKGSTMALTGDSIAMNQGAINLQLTSGSILTGRVDNSSAYQHTDYRRLFAPVSDTDTLPEAIGAGEVNLSLANNAVWNMTGQSWVSQLGGAGGIINLRAMTNGGVATQGRALHIDSLEGKQKFVLSLNKDDYTQSDMLYIKQGTADEQTLVIQNLDELAASMQPDDRVRFATVSHSLDEFREGKIYRSDAGLFEQSLKVHYVSRAKESEQDLAQDRLINGTQFTLEKSGDEYIRQQYDGDESKNVYLVKMTPSPVNPPVEEQPVVEEPITTPGNPTDQPRVEEPTETPEDLVESTPILPPIVNRPAMMAIQYIPALSLRYLTDLDTYTKREGTQAYANPAQKAGFWARVSRLGLKDDFSLKGNTYEIGYDRFMRNDMKRKHKWGVSYTYGSVHGDFTTWRANAHLKKHMLSLYSTNHYGNYDQDAYYNDNAVRIGKLIHDYRIDRENGKLWGEGGYHQYFASVSTEHGYRAWLNKTKTWYVTPQIQLQYSYLRGKSYQSSNQVNIKLGHVNSLIGRLGVDAVKVLDKETQTRIYARASILHELLGKQHIQAHDRTGNYHRTFKMKGTWGVIGGGFSIIPDKNTYVFLDGEKTFGAHRDGYNFRVGLSWRFN